MSATRIASEFTYRSGIPSSGYRFTVLVDETGGMSVRDIQGPYGLIIDTVTSLPQSVIVDVSDAFAQVENILAQTSAVNGILVFVADTEMSYTFATVMADTSYRVVLSPSDFVPLRITKTTTGFTVTAAATFSGSVGFDVFV